MADSLRRVKGEEEGDEEEVLNAIVDWQAT
jgi:hypothetical protein